MLGSTFARAARRGVCAAALALSLAGPAAADASTIGHTLTSDASCTPGVLWVDTSYVVPSAGWITSFAYQSVPDSAGGSLSFKVLRPTSASNYSVVGTTAVETLQTNDAVETFAPAAPIAVQAGDILGFWIAGSQLLQGCVSFETGTAQYQWTDSDPEVGSTFEVIGDYGNVNVSAEFTTSLGTSCSVTAVRRGLPGGDQADVTVLSAAGLKTIDATRITNGSISVPTFPEGTQLPVVVTATRADQGIPTKFSFNATDIQDNVKFCA